MVCLDEERNRVSFGDDLVSSFVLGLRWPNDSVQASANDVVCKSLKGFSTVNQHLGGRITFHGVKVPRLLLVFHLESTNLVLEQHGEDTEVGMWPDASAGACCDSLEFQFREVVESKLAVTLHDFFCERIPGDSETHLNGAHQLHAQLLTSIIVFLHKDAESFHAVGFGLFRKLIWEFWIIYASLIKVLL